MTSEKEINSTEKLLEVIRGKNTDEYQIDINPEDSSSKKQKTSKIVAGLPNVFLKKKIYTIGVDIGHSAIRLSKTLKTTEGRKIFVDHKVIDYNNAKVTKGSPEFNSILKSALSSFCGNPANCDIWALISAAEISVSHIKVPRVPKKQLDNIVYWTAKKDNPFEEKDFVFDFELQGEIVDQGIPKYSVMFYLAPKKEVEKIKTIFSDIGIALTGVTITPFAIQNIIREKLVSAGDRTLAMLFIGNDFSRIDIFSNDNLVMTRGIKTGITSMMESIADSLGERNRALRLGKEEARKILLSICPESENLKETDPGFGLQEQEIYEMVLPVLERLVRQVERTLEHFATSLNLERVEKIFISSAVNLPASVVQFIGEQLGIKSEFFDPFLQQPSHPAAESISLAEKMFLVPAFGLSLSDNFHTPNAIFTYLQKNREVYIKKLNRSIFAAFAAGLIICVTALSYQVVEAKLLGNQLEKLNKELSLYNPLLTPAKIEKMAAEVAQKRQITRKYAGRYTYLAIIGEISDMTPTNIRLLNMKISPLSDVKGAGDKAQKEDGANIVLEGLVIGNRDLLDSMLAQYVMKLEYSPMLKQVSVPKSAVVKFIKDEALQFTINLKFG